MSLDGDLELWESGELSRQALMERGAEAEALLLLHDRLSALATEPVPDPTESWDALRERLPARLPRRRHGLLARPLLVAAVVVALTAAVAAAAPTVRHGLSGTWQGITHVFVGHPRTLPVTGLTDPSLTPSQTPSQAAEATSPGATGTGEAAADGTDASSRDGSSQSDEPRAGEESGQPRSDTGDGHDDAQGSDQQSDQNSGGQTSGGDQSSGDQSSGGDSSSGDQGSGGDASSAGDGTGGQSQSD